MVELRLPSCNLLTEWPMLWLCIGLENFLLMEVSFSSFSYFFLL
jgi:hypothetical protein